MVLHQEPQLELTKSSLRNIILMRGIEKAVCISFKIQCWLIKHSNILPCKKQTKGTGRVSSRVPTPSPAQRSVTFLAASSKGTQTRHCRSPWEVWFCTAIIWLHPPNNEHIQNATHHHRETYKSCSKQNGLPKTHTNHPFNPKRRW